MGNSFFHTVFASLMILFFSDFFHSFSLSLRDFFPLHFHFHFFFAEEIAATMPDKAWIPMQFSNPANARIHYDTTAEEIIRDFPESVDYMITVKKNLLVVTFWMRLGLPVTFVICKLSIFRINLSDDISGNYNGIRQALSGTSYGSITTVHLLPVAGSGNRGSFLWLRPPAEGGVAEHESVGR